jgi:holo-[acyl-carrier protein] synthase
MILGLGTDLCDIRRIENTLKRFGQRFLERIYTEPERAKAMARPNPAASLAQAYAAKEACSKALGTGIREGVYWRNMELKNLPSGKPYMVLSGGAEKRLAGMLPEGTIGQVDISLSDEYPMAQAVVIISTTDNKQT